MSWQTRIQQGLQQRQQQNRLRQRVCLQSPQQPHVMIEGQTYLAFCSNDYLGLANHPDVIQTLCQVAQQDGVGSGASHLVNGHHRWHHQLEEALADWCQREAVLLFSTGYMANQGVLAGLLQRGDRVLADRWNHASLIDGALLSGAQFKRYRHADTAHLAQLLQQDCKGQSVVVTDGVFSMDGDVAPLETLAQLAQQHQALLMVDDAHGFGVLHQGRGSCAALDATQVPLLVGTLGKAFGTFGAFVAADRAVLDYLTQMARSYIYTTALPPALAAATLTSLRLMQQETWRYQVLQQRIAQFRQGCAALDLQLMPSDTPIQPIVLGTDAAALAWSALLKERGLWVTAIRPPTVPEGTARLRVTLSAAHTEQDVQQLLDGLAYCQQHSTVEEPYHHEA